jgi:hypothetical protein
MEGQIVKSGHSRVDFAGLPDVILIAEEVDVGLGVLHEL